MAENKREPSAEEIKELERRYTIKKTEPETPAQAQDYNAQLAKAMRAKKDRKATHTGEPENVEQAPSRTHDENKIYTPNINSQRNTPLKFREVICNSGNWTIGKVRTLLQSLAGKGFVIIGKSEEGETTYTFIRKK